jgi:hypothetical protein
MPDIPDAKGASTYRKAGIGAWTMAHSHSAIGLFVLFLSVGGIYRYMGGYPAIASLGLTVLVIVGVKIHHWAEATSEKADRFTDRAIGWKRGAATEEGVGGLLEALPDSYFVFTDFVTDKGTADFIVVGPKGVLTFETKSHRGVVTNAREKLTQDGHPFEEDMIKKAWAKSHSVRNLLAEKSVCTLRTQPVIVFTDADVQVDGKVGGVHVVGIKDLPAFLEGLPVWMSERLSKSIIDCLWSTQKYESIRQPGWRL